MNDGNKEGGEPATKLATNGAVLGGSRGMDHFNFSN